MSRLVVLDRDGTLNVEKNYLADPDEVELLPNAALGVRQMTCLGLKAVVVTNQSAITRGYFDLLTLTQIHSRLREKLEEGGATLDGIYYCPHVPEQGCLCRKPATGLLEQASRDLGALPAESFVIGDQASDIEMGKRAGAVTLLVKTGYGLQTLNASMVSPDYVVADLLEASQIISDLLQRLPNTP